MTLLFTYASFSQYDIFYNYCPIDSTTMSTAYSQHIHIVLFNTTLPSILTLLFTYAFLFTMWIFFHNYCTIDSTTISTAYPQHIYTVLFTITQTQYTDFAITYAILFTIWYFFTITAQLTLQQFLQHILNIYIRYCLQLHYPVYWLCCLYMLPLHNVTFFHNYCTIDSTTMFTAYPQHIHAVLFTIIHPVCWLFCLHMLSFSQCEYFSTVTV